jgi:hypothetical protein
MELLMKGELSDDALGVVGKIFDAIETGGKMIRGEKGSAYRYVEDSAGQLAQLFTNIPVKNIMRDARAMWNLIVDQPYAKRENSKAVLYYQLVDLLTNSQNLTGVVNQKMLGEKGWETKNDAYYSRIYQADAQGKQKKVDDMIEYLTLARNLKEKTITEKLRGLTKTDKKLTDEEKIEKLRKQGMEDSDIANWVTDRYKKKEITKEEATALYQKANPKKDADDAYFSFERTDAKEKGEKVSNSDYFRLDAALEKNDRTEISKAEDELKRHGYSKEKIEDHKIDWWFDKDREAYQKETGNTEASGRYYRLKDAISANSQDRIASTIKLITKHGVTTNGIKSWITKEYKEQYIAATVDGRRQLQNKLVKVYKEIGVSAADAAKTMQNWVLKDNKKSNK